MSEDDNQTSGERSAKFKRAVGGDNARLINRILFDKAYDTLDDFNGTFDDFVMKKENIFFLLRAYYWDLDLFEMRWKDVERWYMVGLVPGENKQWVRIFKREVTRQYRETIKAQNDTLTVQADMNTIRQGDKGSGDEAGSINDLF